MPKTVNNKTQKRAFIIDEASDDGEHSGDEIVELKKTAEDEAFIDDDPELENQSTAAELEAERRKTEMACETPKNKSNNGGSVTLKEKLEEACAQSKLMDDGHFDDCLRCPICSMRVAESTSDDGETNIWCPNHCPLPWKPNNQKAAFFGELSVHLQKEFVNPNSPPTCTHKETCKLVHLIGERIKNPDLQDTLFWVCNKKVNDGQCSTVVSAECEGEQAEFLELIYRNRGRNIDNSAQKNRIANQHAFRQAAQKAKRHKSGGLIALEGEHLLPLASRIARTRVSLLRLRINVSLGKVMFNWVNIKQTWRPE